MWFAMVSTIFAVLNGEPVESVFGIGHVFTCEGTDRSGLGFVVRSTDQSLQ